MNLSLLLWYLSITCVFSGCSPATIETSETPASTGDTEGETQLVSTASKTEGTVAVINLGEVARQLGESQRWKTKLDVRETELNERLEVMKLSFEKELESKKSEMGEELTPEQDAEIKQMTAKFNTSILQEREYARKQYADLYQALEVEFRDKVKPTALEVAREQGFGLVVQHSSVFAYAPKTDITVAVISRLSSSPDFAKADKAGSERVSQKLPGGGQFRPNK